MFFFSIPVINSEIELCLSLSCRCDRLILPLPRDVWDKSLQLLRCLLDSKSLMSAAKSTHLTQAGKPCL